MGEEQDLTEFPPPAVQPSPVRKWLCFAWKVPAITVPLGIVCFQAGTYVNKIKEFRDDSGFLVLGGIFLAIYPTMAVMCALPGAIANNRSCQRAGSIEALGYFGIAFWPFFIAALIWSLVAKQRPPTPPKKVRDGWFVPEQAREQQ